MFNCDCIQVKSVYIFSFYATCRESVCSKYMHYLKFMHRGLDEGGVHTTKWKSMHTVAARHI